MGIPLYYKNIINDYPEIISKPLLKYNKKINNLLFDLNCGIHPCCANKTNEEEMFHSILQKINECIELTKVQDLIYIAIDGPAPRTKMEQQRQRRLKSSYEKKIWDTNQITPGTDFMIRLNSFLREKIKDFKIKTILSDSNEPGEGEHKIMEFLDKNINPNEISIVYGLDADLIMLSMIREHKIYLLRERTEYNIEHIDEAYVYLNVNLLKEYVIESIKKPQNNYTINDKTLLNDYLFICFLIGNDFIINSPCINIRYDGIHTLVTIYSNLQDDFLGSFYLIDNKTINIDNFKLFIQKISENEKNFINSILKKRKLKSKYNIKKFNEYLEKIKSIKEIEKYTYEDFEPQDEYKYNTFVNFSPLIFRDIEDTIFNNNNYRKRYYIYNIYNTLDYNPSYDMIIKEDIKEVCKEYFKSIHWTFNYYFNECKSWRWYYKYHFAPLMIDLSRYLSIIKKEDLIFNEDKPYTPKEQLKIVLPFQENNYMYPYKTPIQSLLKNYLWECHQILPHEMI